MKKSDLEETVYDAVVVGAGHNGLVCAAYLAQAGYRVAIVERRPHVGGATITEELFDGFKFSTASVVMTLFRQEIMDDLSLNKHGLRVIPRDPSVTALFPDGRTLTLTYDEDKAEAEISKFSKHDAERYADFGETMRRIAAVAEPLLLGPSRTPLFDDIPALKAVLKTALKMPDSDLSRLMRAMFGSARDLLSEWFTSDELKVTLCTDGTVGFDAGPSAPGTAYLMLYHSTGATESGRPSWGHVVGGMGGVSKALVAACEELKVDILTGMPVERIRVGDHGAEAVECSDGRVVRGRVIVSAADPKTTFLKLVDSPKVPQSYRSAIQGRDYEGIAAKIHFAVDRLPTVRGFDGPGPHLRGTMQILPSMDHLDQVHAEASQGRPPREPHVEITIPSVLDPDLAPPGKHVLSMYCQYIPYTLNGQNWDDIKEEWADSVVEYVKPYLPDLKEITIGRKVLTPLDLEREIGLPGGNLYHGAMSAYDLFAGRPVAGYPDYHTPVRGLFLCGSGTRPGGGVFGWPGKNASEAVRRHLGDDDRTIKD